MVFVIIIMVESLVGKSEEKQPCTRSHYHKASSWQKSYVQMVKTIGFDPWAIIFSWVLRRRVAQITSFEAWSIISLLFQKGLPVHIHQQQQLVSINVSRPKPFSMSAYTVWFWRQWAMGLQSTIILDASIQNMETVSAHVYVFRLLVIEYHHMWTSLWAFMVRYHHQTKSLLHYRFFLSLKMPHGIFLVLYVQYRLPHLYK